MYCTECGLQVPDDAQSCPYCGENLEEVVNIIKDKVIVSKEPSLDSDIIVFVEGEATAVPKSNIQTIKIVVQNNSLKSLPNIKVQISSTPQVKVLTRTKSFGYLNTGERISSSFEIIPRVVGTFTLAAILTSGRGHSLKFPIDINIKAVDSRTAPMESSHPEDIYPPPSGTKTNNQLIAFIVLGVIGAILMTAGILTIFRGGIPLNGSITMIVIGFILITISTKGKCLWGLLFCAYCDCN
ncbi:MAG: zinc-ribbon domain-containing protein [Candidatus Thorarchaeota archaeon]